MRPTAFLVVFVLLAAGAVAIRLEGMGDPARASLGTRPVGREGEVRFIRASPGVFYDTPAWIPRAHAIAVAVSTGDPRKRAIERRIALVRLAAGGRTELIGLPKRQGCPKLDAGDLRALPNGRLGFVEWCLGNAAAVPRRSARLMELDLADGRVRQLRPYFLPFFVGSFDFRPDMRVGILQDRRGLHEQLLWLYRRKLVPVKLPLTRAGRPSWSPEGRWIAFDGAPVDHGARGLDRLDLPRKLYLLSRRTGRLVTLASGVRNASQAPAWSPDGRWIAVSMTLGREQGLWVVDIRTRRRVFLMRRPDLGRAVWLPDGRTIVVSSGASEQFIRGKADVGLYVVTLPKDIVIVRRGDR